RGQAPQWTPLPVQYADYALWQQQLLGDPADPDSLAARQLAHWRATLADLPEVLPLPTDRPRPPHQSFRGALTRFTVDADLHRRITALAAAHDATVFMTVHAALAVLLARLSGTGDIAIGTPVAGRGHRALDDLVGMFVNTVVLRTPVDGATPFTDHLHRTREIDLSAFGHTELPFEKLVDALAPTRATDHSPLFQVVLEFQNTERAHLDLPEVTVDALDTDLEVAKFDLQLSLQEHPATGGMTGAFTYATDLFDPETAAAFAARFLRLLDAVTADPHRPVGDLDLRIDADAPLPPAAPHTPARDTLVALFTRAAARTPDAVAVTAPDGALTYRQLEARVHRLARALLTRGAGPDTLVAVALPRTTDLIVALLAVLDAGAAYLPIDVAYPADRLAYMFTDADPVCVLTTREQTADLPDTTPPALVLDDPGTAAELDAQSEAAVTD
ncbi:condensation domain-containing protein, partial [Rhodococcus chondri]